MLPQRNQSQKPRELRRRVMLRARMREEPFSTAMANVWRAVDVESVLARFIADTRLARTIAGQEGDNLNTDDLPVIEFEFAKTVGTTLQTGSDLALASSRARSRR